ncbi:MAG: aminotransferase class V-fold PLP-dependent enzyme [Actinomycetota bacterium]|nr:aminotransferase class V-fold PLP-dependent enzyme [Actinomycetota bacterium]
MSDSSPRRLDRRALLVRGGLVVGASSVAGAGGYLAAREVADRNGTAAAAGSESVSGRDERLFALDRDHVNLTTFLLASHPRVVREAIERHRRKLDADAALYLRESETALEEAARAAAAGYLGADPEHVALTDSTTMGLGLVYARLRLERGDEVVTTEHDFYATHEALRLRQELDGITVRRIRLYEEPEAASAEAIVAAVSHGIGPGTRCLALTWVHSSTGVKLPLREIADVVARVNRRRRERGRVLLSVDGVHGFGVEDASPVDLGADVFVSGCHKWLFGPRGTGLVWASRRAWDRLRPTIPTFDGRAYRAWIERRAPKETPPGPLMTPGGFHSFEHRWALADAFALHEQLGGRAKVAATTHALARRLKRGLAEIDGVTVKTPMDDALSAGLVCADVAGLSAPEAVDRLREDHGVVASVTPYAIQHLRFGPSIANTEEDVERALAAVAELARR